MAGPWFVNSNATGSGTGLSWTNAATTISACLALGVVAGDTIWVGDNHSESTGSTTTPVFPGTIGSPNLVVCANHLTTNPGAADWTTGALLTVTGSGFAWRIEGSAYFYGLHWAANANIYTCYSGGYQRYDTCILELTASSGGGNMQFAYSSNTQCDLLNTSLKFGATTQAISANSQNGLVQWRNSTAFASGSSIPTALWTTSAAYPFWINEGVDFSAKTSGTLMGGVTGTLFQFIGCRFNSGVTQVATPPGINTRIFITNADSGATNYQLAQYTMAGAETTEITVVRTGGTSDNITTVTRKIVTTTNCSQLTPYQSLFIDKWNVITGSAITAVVRGIWNAAALPTNAQVWSEARFLGNASYPLYSFVNNAPANASTTATSVTADTGSAWDGAAVQVARSTAYTTASAPVKDSANPGRLFWCTTNGTTSGTNPGYSGATDGTTVTDGTAVFRAGVRFALSLTMTSPQLAGSTPICVYVGAASTTLWIDPQINSS